MCADSWLVVMTLSVFLCLGAGSAHGRAALSAPDAEVHRLLDELGATGRAPGDMLRTLAAISDATGGDPERLAEQLIVYIRDGGERELWNASFVMWRHDIDKQTLLRHAAPWLSHEDARMRNLGREIVKYVIEWRERDMSEIERYLRDHRNHPQRELVRMIFSQWRFDALQLMIRVDWADAVRVDQIRPDKLEDRNRILQSASRIEHVLSHLWGFRLVGRDEAVRAMRSDLEALSVEDAWWARLYVAVIIERNTEFHRGDLINRLRDDEHPVVRSLVEKIPR